MTSEEFENAVRPDSLWNALEPFTPPVGDNACAVHHSDLFDSPERQQAAFDDEPLDPDIDYSAAREICWVCPLLAECRQYALDSRIEDTFLAGMTVEQRKPLFTKRTEIAKRRRQVAALHELDAPVAVIAETLQRDQSLIRRDLHALNIDAERPGSVA